MLVHEISQLPPQGWARGLCKEPRVGIGDAPIRRAKPVPYRAAPTLALTFENSRGSPCSHLPMADPSVPIPRWSHNALAKGGTGVSPLSSYRTRGTKNIF